MVVDGVNENSHRSGDTRSKGNERVRVHMLFVTCLGCEMSDRKVR
jgi:hypothetical protein